MKMKAEEEEYAEEQEFSVISNNYNLAEHLNKKNVSKLKLKQFYVIKWKEKKRVKILDFIFVSFSCCFSGRPLPPSEKQILNVSFETILLFNISGRRWAH